MPIVILTSRKLLKSLASQEAEPARVIPEAAAAPVSDLHRDMHPYKGPEVRYLIDAETGKCSAVAIDQDTGATWPLTIRVTEAVAAMLQAAAAKAIQAPVEEHYAYDKAAQAIQIIFTDPKTGKVLEKLPTDQALAMQVVMREAAGIVDTSA